MACTNLPQELIDHIHDFLSDDKNALRSCSLVCRAWFHPARKRLFVKLALKPNNVVPLVNSASAVIPFVRHLILKTTEPWESKIPLLAGFEAIKTLSISLNWSSFPAITRSVFFNQFSAIVCLELRFILTASFTELAEIICALRSLERLHILTAVSELDDEDDTLPPSTLFLPPNLSSLELRIANIGLFCEWLLSFKEPPAIRNLYLPLRPYHVEAVANLVSALGPCLEKLRISQCASSINLGHNPGLRWILLYIWIDERLPRYTEAIADTLVQIISTQIMELRFGIRLRMLDLPYGSPWHSIDTALSQPQFSTLQRVVFEFPCLEDRNSDPMPWLSHRLPQCHARGILSFDLDEKEAMLL